MKELKLNVTGMVCTGCENRIKNSVSELKEVKEVTASHETGVVNITCKKDISEDVKETIIKRIEQIGFHVE